MKKYDNDPNMSSEKNEESVTPDSVGNSPEFSPREPHHNPIGAIIGTVILFALLILGALYVYGSRLSAVETDNNASAEQVENEFSERGDEPDDLKTQETELDEPEDFDNTGTEEENNFDTELTE